jgi:molybdopterin-guanine dinucleotide biosynthesis protein A
VACDMPFIKKSLVQYLIENVVNEDVIVPRTRDGLQPLHAIYSKHCVDPIRKSIEEGKSKIIDIYDQVNVKIVDEKDFLCFDPGRESFINVNTPEELVSLRRNREPRLK